MFWNFKWTRVRHFCGLGIKIFDDNRKYFEDVFFQKL